MPILSDIADDDSPETKTRTSLEIDYMYEIDLPMRGWRGELHQDTVDPFEHL